jgi:hypothetical protein
MNTLVNTSLAKKVSFEDDIMIIEFLDDRKLSVPIAFFPRLLKATDNQRKSFTISGGGIGIHWDEIDEDIHVENLLLGFGDTTVTQNPNSKTAA